VIRGATSDIAVLLTATIQPSIKIPNLTIRDPKLRLKEYEKSIRWWTRCSSKNGFDLFVAENSGHAQDLRNFESSNVSIIAIEPQAEDSVLRGKGSGESQILKMASEVLSPYQLGLKCTGRLQVLNAAQLIHIHRLNPEVRAMISWDSSLNRVDTRCFSFQPSFLRNWMTSIEEVVSDEIGCDLESTSARWLMAQVLARQFVMDFPRTPAIVGRSGSVGITYTRRKALSRIVIERIVRGRLKTDPR
jgi:hypothetical protein